MQRILRSRTRRLRSHQPVCGSGQLSAPDAAGTASASGVATLAPAFGQALPSLADVRAEYNHEVNAELVYELCAALVREGLGTAETWKKSGGNALAFAQHAMMSAIGAERGDLLQRNVEYHLEVSDQLGRAGSDAELESGQLVVTVECGGSGYFRIGPALDALEAEAEGLGAAFYWALTFALYRVMWIYNHDNALMYEERMRDYAAEDDAENQGSMSFPKWRRRCRSASGRRRNANLLIGKHATAICCAGFAMANCQFLVRAVAAHSAPLPASAQAVAGVSSNPATTTILHCRLCLSPSKSMTPSPPASTKRASP